MHEVYLSDFKSLISCGWRVGEFGERTFYFIFFSAFLQTVFKDATLSFALPVYPFSHIFQCLAVRICQLQCHRKDSHYVWSGVLLLLSVDTLNSIKIEQPLLSLYMTLYMSSSDHSKWKIFGTQGVGKARHVFFWHIQFISESCGFVTS